MEGGRPPPQLPFSRNTNTASPYSRSSFPPAPNGQASQYPTSSHPPNGPPPYADHQRRTSDSQYFQQPRYQDGPPIHGGGHSRHPSSSSIGHGTPVGRGMPPPSSPQQQQHQGPMPHGYGTPHPRAPPVSLGPPVGFPSGRELPPPPLNRPPSTAGSQMSISSMLGGPTPVTREQMPSQYTSPIGTSAPPPMYPNAPHASPRVSSATNEYASFARPRTPEQRYDSRDHRANSAGSPAGTGPYGTPDHRIGTPQQYNPQLPPNSMAQHPEDRRDPHGMRHPGMHMPPRPNSQPMAYSGPVHRSGEHQMAHGDSQFGGRRIDQDPRGMENLPRGDPMHPRHHPGFSNRADPAIEFMERERDREREQWAQRERSIADREAALAVQEQQARSGQVSDYPHQVPPRNQPPYYARQQDPREQGNWNRPGYEQQRHGFEPPQFERPPSHPPHSNGYDHPRSATSQYQNRPGYDPVPLLDQRDPRYAPVSHPQPHPPPQQVMGSGPHFEAPYDERMPRGLDQRQQQHAARQQAIDAQARAMQPQQLVYGGPAPPNSQYQPHDSPQRRLIEEAPQMMQQHSQRSLLSVQDNRRGGRVSPIPQAVQGAQVQQPGPAGEPGIKSEFGRVFQGIGSGVGATMSMPSPVVGPAASGLPFSGPRREDIDSPPAHNSPIENSGPMTARPIGRRRKLKEENKGDDDSSTGRQTPNGRGKRTKHAAHRHHHHHRPDPQDRAASPTVQSMTPFKSIKGTANGNVSPPHGERSVVPHHHIQRHHHHHHSAGPKVTAPMNTIIRIPKYEVKSQAIVDAASSYPRCHLGHEYYQPDLKLFRSASFDSLPSNRGFASTNRAFPNFEGKINCTYTIKVSRAHLKPSSREEITYRKNLWGTDVYTDDSDIVAACIHQGWFCGKWAADVDVKLLNLYPSDEGVSVEPELDTIADGPDELFDRPPARGPMPVRANRDLHVTVLVLDCLDKYTSKVRFGIKSREWGGDNTAAHDGLSYLIMNIKWVNGVDGMQNGNVASKNFIRMQHQEIVMDRQQQEADQEREMWLEKRMNGNGKRVPDHGNDGNKAIEASDLRGDQGQQVLGNGEIRGVGMGSWWKGNSQSSSRRIDDGQGPTSQKASEMVGDGTASSKAAQRQVPLPVSRTTNGPTATAPHITQPESMPVPLKTTATPEENKKSDKIDSKDNNMPAGSMNQLLEKEGVIPEETSVPESMDIDTPDPHSLMLDGKVEVQNPLVQPMEDLSNRQDEVSKVVESIRGPNHHVSDAEIQNPAVQKPDESITAQKAEPAKLTEMKDEKSVPVVEVPMAAPETQAQAQTMHTSSPIVEADTVADADSSASAPATN